MAHRSLKARAMQWLAQLGYSTGYIAGLRAERVI